MAARLDAVAFSSLWAACAAAALTVVAATVLGLPNAGAPAALAFAGTFVVYNIDRLRDLERDFATAPLRSHFVANHRRLLTWGVGAAGLASAFLAWRLGPPVIVLCLVCIIPGLFHRRLKNHPGVKTGYVTAAWVTVTIGLPIFSAPGRLDSIALAGVPWLVGIYASTLAANLIASNLRDTEHSLRGAGPQQALWMARGLTLVGTILAWAAGTGWIALAWIPLAEAAALMRFRESERYGLWVIDGALVGGSLLALGFAQ